MNKIFKTLKKTIRRFDGYIQNTVVVSENASSLSKATDNRSVFSENRTSFKQFLGLKIGDKIPDEKIILGIPNLSKEEQKTIISSFDSELKLYNEIENLNNQITSIHVNFLGINK